jgi:outer membrane protein assembly factor BamA
MLREEYLIQRRFSKGLLLMLTKCRNMIPDKEIYHYNAYQPGKAESRNNYPNTLYVTCTFDSVAPNIIEMKQNNTKQI